MPDAVPSHDYRTVSLNSSSSLVSWRHVGWLFYAFVILALGTMPIVGTYPVVSHTTDEPAHIAAGMELLDRGTFTYEQQHPPLARLAVAIGPYLWGARSHGASYIIDEGLAILYTSGDYLQTLSAARLGVLPFFVALVAITLARTIRIGESVGRNDRPTHRTPRGVIAMPRRAPTHPGNFDLVPRGPASVPIQIRGGR